MQWVESVSAYDSPDDMYSTQLDITQIAELHECCNGDPEHDCNEAQLKNNEEARGRVLDSAKSLGFTHFVFDDYRSGVDRGKIESAEEDGNDVVPSDEALPDAPDEAELHTRTAEYVVDRCMDNHLNPSAPHDGKMFETYGQELEFVKSQEPDRIWTLVDVDGHESIVHGFHFVNRIGYFVLENR
jgi:hypothetical protein